MVSTPNGGNDHALRSHPEKRRKHDWTKLLFGLVLLAVVLTWNNGASQMLDALRGFKIEYLAALFVVAVGTNGISGFKWGLFLKDRGHHLPWWRLFGLYLIGRFFNNFLPSMFGGDVARSYILGRQIGSQSVSAASVILERLSGLVGLAILAGLGCLVNPDILGNPIIAVPLILAIFGTVLGTIAFFRPGVSALLIRILGRIPLLNRIAPKAERLLNAIGEYRTNRALLLKSLVYSFGFHLLAAINVYVACRSIGFDPMFADIIVVTPVILLLSMIPVSPNNVGWWEFCFGVLLVSAGATTGEGVAVALVIRAVTFLFSLCGGLLMVSPAFRNPPTTT